MPCFRARKGSLGGEIITATLPPPPNVDAIAAAARVAAAAGGRGSVADRLAALAVAGASVCRSTSAAMRRTPPRGEDFVLTAARPLLAPPLVRRADPSALTGNVVVAVRSVTEYDVDAIAARLVVTEREALLDAAEAAAARAAQRTAEAVEAEAAMRVRVAIAAGAAADLSTATRRAAALAVESSFNASSAAAALVLTTSAGRQRPLLAPLATPASAAAASLRPPSWDDRPALAVARAAADAVFFAGVAVAAEAEAEAEADAEADAAFASAAEAQAQAEADAEAEAEAKAEEDAEAKAEARAEARAKVVADAKARGKAKTIAKAEARAAARAEARAEVDAEAKAGARAEARAEAELGARTIADLLELPAAAGAYLAVRGAAPAPPPPSTAATRRRPLLAPAVGVFSSNTSHNIDDNDAVPGVGLGNLTDLDTFFDTEGDKDDDDNESLPPPPAPAHPKPPAAVAAQVASLRAQVSDLKSRLSRAHLRSGGTSSNPFSSLGAAVKEALLESVVFTVATPADGAPPRSAAAARLARDFAQLATSTGSLLPCAGAIGTGTAPPWATPDAVATAPPIFADAAAAAAAVAAGALAGGATALVPLSGVVVALSQLANAERLVAAYEADNYRLRAASPAVGAEGGALPVGAAAADAAAERAELAAALRRIAELEAMLLLPAGSTATVTTTATTTNIVAAATVSALLSEIDRLRGDATRAADDARIDLARVRDHSRAREIELGSEVERVRRAARDAEARAAGVDVGRLAAEGAELAKARAEAAAERAGLEEKLAGADARIAWYRETQAIVDADAEARAEQADVIRDLQARLRSAEAAASAREARERLVTPRDRLATGAASAAPSLRRPLGGGVTPVSPRTDASPLNFPDSPPNLSPPSISKRPPTVRADADASEVSAALRRAADAEAALAVANEALARRFPDSLANLIREAKGATNAPGEPAAALAELGRLRKAGEDSDASHDRALRALRQDFERSTAEWILRLARADADGGALRTRLAALGDSGDGGSPETAVSAVSKREVALRARNKELETELERVRAFYVKRGLESTSRGVSPVPPSSVPTAPSVAASQSQSQSRGVSHGLPVVSRAPSRGPSPAASGRSLSRGTSPAPGRGVGGGAYASRRSSLVSKAPSPVPSDDGVPPGGGDSSPPRAPADTAAATAAAAIARAHAQVARLEEENSALRAVAELAAEAVGVAKAARLAAEEGPKDESTESQGAAYLVSLESENASLRVVAELAFEAVSAARVRAAEDALLAPTTAPGGVEEGAETETPPALARAQAQLSRLEIENEALREVASLAIEAVEAARESAHTSFVNNDDIDEPQGTRLSRLEEENVALRAVAELAAEAVRAARAAAVSRAAHSTASGSPLSISPKSEGVNNVEKSGSYSLLTGAQPLPTPLADSLRAGGGGVSSKMAALSAIPPWAAAARARQEELCRTVDSLYGAVALLEARAEVREAELARAESSAGAAADARERLMRAQFEAAVSVKDSALRAARDQVAKLASALGGVGGRLETRPPGSSPIPSRAAVW